MEEQFFDIQSIDAKNVGRIISTSRTWVVDQGYAGSVLNILDNISASDWLDYTNNANIRAQESAVNQRNSYKVSGDTAYITITGPITKRPNSMASMLGEDTGASSLIITESIKKALSDKSVDKIALVIDSPGGDVAGTYDLADFIYNARQQKPIIAFISDLGTSGAYLIASQCSKIFVNENAIVGNIGAYTVIQDSSEAAQKDGYKILVIKSAKYKAGNVPGAPVSEEYIERAQKQVDNFHNLFVDKIGRGRGMDIKDVKKLADGNTFFGKEAIDVGLADGISSIDQIEQIMQGIEVNVKEGDKIKVEDENPQTSAQIQFLSQNPNCIGIIEFLNGINIKSVADVQSMYNDSKTGKKYIEKLREDVQKMSIVALGPESAEDVKAIVEDGNINVLEALMQQYTKIAENLELIPKSERKTSPTKISDNTEKTDEDDDNGDGIPNRFDPRVYSFV